MSVYERKKGQPLWENARLMIADIPLDREKAGRLLPLGMRLGEKPRGTVFIADYTKTSFTVPYREAALLIHVRTPFGRGVHCPWMVVDDDTALAYGREMLGYPKKMAGFTFSEKGGHVHATVTRRNIGILSFKLTLGPPQSSPGPVFDIKTFNVGGPGQFFYVNPIWLFRARERIQESYEARPSLAVTPSVYDPLAGLVSGEPFNARFVVMDILGGGYFLPVGMAGPLWLGHVHTMRFE